MNATAEDVERAAIEAEEPTTPPESIFAGLPAEDIARVKRCRPEEWQFLVDLWHCAQAYERKLQANNSRATSFEKELARNRQSQERRQHIGILERALNGKLGDIAKHMAEEFTENSKHMSDEARDRELAALAPALLRERRR